jgi:hypothetical protein
MNRDAVEREEEMREILRNDASLRTSAVHDAAVLSAARAFADAPPAQKSSLRQHRGRRALWPAAAGVAAVMISLALAWRVVQQQRELAVVSAEKVQLARLVGRLEEEIAALERSSTSLAEALKRAEQGEASVAQSSGAVARILATIVLAPGAVRGENETPVVRAPAGAGTIRMQLDLGAVAQHDAYRALIATSGGKEVWRSGALAARGEGTQRSLILDAPASALGPGAYEISLRAEASSEDLTYYYFEIARR